VSFVANHFFWRENATPPFMLELPDYKMPRLRSILLGLYTRAMMFLKRAGTTIFSMMVLIWFLGLVPASAGGRRRTRDRLQPRRHPRQMAGAGAGAGRFQLADRRRAHSRHGRAGSCRCFSRHGLCIEGGKEAAEQIGQALAGKWSLATALALLAWYVFAPQCASTLAVIPPRDRRLALHVHHLLLHAGIGLCGGVSPPITSPWRWARAKFTPAASRTH